jgi:hypothetical protein
MFWSSWGWNCRCLEIVKKFANKSFYNDAILTQLLTFWAEYIVLLFIHNNVVCGAQFKRASAYLRRQGVALSIGPHWVGVCLRTETESSLSEEDRTMDNVQKVDNSME